MAAVVHRHALILRVRRLALAGLAGIWLMAGILDPAPARAEEPGEAAASPNPSSPSGAPPFEKALAPAPPAKIPTSPHQAYLFFSGGKQIPRQPTTPKPEGATARSGHAQRPAYLFFTPGKRKPGPSAQAPIGPVRDSKRSGPVSDRDAPAPASDVVEGAAQMLPQNQKLPHPQLIFFTPKRDPANPLRPPGSTPKPRIVGPQLAAADRVPKRPTRPPLPYLFFQPKPTGDRRAPAGNANQASSAASASSRSLPPAPAVGSASDQPTLRVR